MHFYQVYGLNIASEPELEELIPGGDGSDIIIRYGKIPAFLNGMIRKGRSFEIAPDEIIFTVPDTARYHIKNGKEIIIEKTGRASHDEIKLFLLGLVLGTLMHQKKEMILHANVLNINEKGILLCGLSGAGKSTITAGFIQKGYKFISDDMALIRFDNCQPFVLPGLPRLKLFLDSIEMMQLEKAKKSKLKHDLDKYHILIPQSFQMKEMPVHKLYVLSTSDTNKIELTELTGVEKFDTILKQFYLKLVTEVLWDRKELFELINRFAAKVTVARINHPKEWPVYEKLLDTILQDIKKI